MSESVTVDGFSPNKSKERSLQIQRVEAGFVRLEIYGGRTLDVEIHVPIDQLIEGLQRARVLQAYAPPKGLMVEAPAP